MLWERVMGWSNWYCGAVENSCWDLKDEQAQRDRGEEKNPLSEDRGQTKAVRQGEVCCIPGRNGGWCLWEAWHELGWRDGLAPRSHSLVGYGVKFGIKTIGRNYCNILSLWGHDLIRFLNNSSGCCKNSWLRGQDLESYWVFWEGDDAT